MAASDQISVLISIAMVIIGVTVYFLLLRWFDWLSGVRFKRDIAPKIRSEPLACAQYYGLRNLAVAMLVASILASVR